MTTKFKIKFSLGVLFLVLLGSSSCANKPIFVKSDPIKDDQENSKNLKLSTIKVTSGPTNIALIKDFEDQTLDYGLKDVKATNIYAVDFNNDGFTDLVFLPEHFSVPQFYRFSNTTKRFEKIEYNPLPEVIRGSYLSFVDFNKDGILDLVVGTLNQKTELTKYPLRFYQGVIKKNNIHYNSVPTKLTGGIRPTATVAFFDFDLDGKIDIFEGNWYTYKGKVSIPINDQLFKGNGFSFQNATGFLDKESQYSREQKKYINARPSFGVSTCDIDQNGYPDIMVSNSSGYSNKLWINQKNSIQNGQRLFKNYGKESGFASDFDGEFSPRGGGNSFYSLCSDYNNDGILDLVVGELSHSYDSESRDRSSFLTGSTRSFPPKFLRTEYHSDTGEGFWNQGDRRGVLVDYDMDGLVDLIVDNSGFPPKSRLILFRQEENHAFADLAQPLGINILNPSGTVTIDIDQDGQMDFITGQSKIRNSAIKPRVYVYINKVNRDKKRSFRFHLKGLKSNTAAYGSMLKLKTDKRVLTKWNETIYGPLPSQNESGVYFGIGHDNAESIEVRWPIKLDKNKSPLIKTYSLKKYKQNLHMELSLCENGKILVGKSSKCSL